MIDYIFSVSICDDFLSDLYKFRSALGCTRLEVLENLERHLPVAFIACSARRFFKFAMRSLHYLLDSLNFILGLFGLLLVRFAYRFLTIPFLSSYNTLPFPYHHFITPDDFFTVPLQSFYNPHTAPYHFCTIPVPALIFFYQFLTVPSSFPYKSSPRLYHFLATHTIPLPFPCNFFTTPLSFHIISSQSFHRARRFL